MRPALFRFDTCACRAGRGWRARRGGDAVLRDGGEGRARGRGGRCAAESLTARGLAGWMVYGLAVLHGRCVVRGGGMIADVWQSSSADSVLLAIRCPCDIHRSYKFRFNTQSVTFSLRIVQPAQLSPSMYMMRSPISKVPSLILKYEIACSLEKDRNRDKSSLQQ